MSCALEKIDSIFVLSKLLESGSVAARTTVFPPSPGWAANMRRILFVSVSDLVARRCPADALNCEVLQPASLSAFISAFIVIAAENGNELCDFDLLGGSDSGVIHSLYATARQDSGGVGSPEETIIGACTAGGGGMGGRSGNCGGLCIIGCAWALEGCSVGALAGCSFEIPRL